MGSLRVWKRWISLGGGGGGDDEMTMKLGRFGQLSPLLTLEKKVNPPPHVHLRVRRISADQLNGPHDVCFERKSSSGFWTTFGPSAKPFWGGGGAHSEGLRGGSEVGHAPAAVNAAPPMRTTEAVPAQVPLWVVQPPPPPFRKDGAQHVSGRRPAGHGPGPPHTRARAARRHRPRIPLTTRGTEVIASSRAPQTPPPPVRACGRARVDGPCLGHAPSHAGPTTTRVGHLRRCSGTPPQGAQGRESLEGGGGVPPLPHCTASTPKGIPVPQHQPQPHSQPPVTASQPLSHPPKSLCNCSRTAPMPPPPLPPLQSKALARGPQGARGAPPPRPTSGEVGRVPGERKGCRGTKAVLMGGRAASPPPFSKDIPPPLRRPPPGRWSPPRRLPSLTPCPPQRQGHKGPCPPPGGVCVRRGRGGGGAGHTLRRLGGRGVVPRPRRRANACAGPQGLRRHRLRSATRP